MANKGDSEETEQLSCQLSDTMQQGTNPRSNPGPDTKEKSESSSEPEEKQKEKTAGIGSTPQTKSPPQSETEPEREVEEEKGSKLERKEGPFGDLPDNAPKKDHEKTAGIGSTPQTKSPPQSDTEPEREVEEEKGSKLERKEGLFGDLVNNAPKEEDEKTAGIGSTPQTKSPPQSDTEPEREVEEEKSSKLEKKGGPFGDLPDNAPKKDHEKTARIGSTPQTKNPPQSDTEPEREVEEEKSSKLERKEGPFGDFSLDNAPKKDDEDVEINENENQDQGQNLQPQITVPGNNKTFWIGAAGVILLAVVCAFMFSLDSTPPVPNEFNVVDVFNQEMKKLETSFPNQHPELWRRSLIHLRRHLKTKNPSEPVSLILTSGHRAENTLGCLAKCLAQAFSTALNSSVLHINGTDKASQDSDQVKLDIDSELRKAFEGKKSAAVVHRFEELPPGSTLIFYRYCDHENAAYKEVFLAFTVMLDAEVEVPSNVNLGRVEEMVQEHIKQKFVSSDKSAMFNQMDIDKLSGLWSRISHLILPVAAEEKIELQGCVECNKSF